MGWDKGVCSQAGGVIAIGIEDEELRGRREWVSKGGMRRLVLFLNGK